MVTFAYSFTLCYAATSSMSNVTATKFTRLDYIKVTIFGLAITALWGSLHSIILPLRLLDFVAESQKNTLLGLMTLTGLLLAMAMQPIAGAISDRSGWKWGRRRPYILVGGIIAVLIIPGIGLVGSYAAIFIVYCLLQLAGNTAQGPFQALIPDFVPAGKRGTASGVKAFMEIFGGIALVYTITYLGDRFFGEDLRLIWLVLGILMGLLLVTILVTMFTVKERPAIQVSAPPFFSSLLNSYRIDTKRSPGFIAFLLSRLLFIMALTTLQSFALYYLRDMVMVANPTRATVELLAVLGIGMVGSVYPAGRLSDKLGHKPVLVSAGIIGAVGIIILLLSRDYAFVLIGGGLQGVAVGAFMASNWALAIDLVPAGEAARYLGLTNLSTAGGAALARLVGVGIDYFNGYSQGLGYQFMFLVCLAYFVIGLVLIFKIKLSSN